MAEVITPEDSEVEQTPMESSSDEKKHPLQNKWTLWHLMGDRHKQLKWEDRLRRVATFGTVEDFWALVNFINPPSKLDNGSDYMLFKDGIQPMWEDVKNKAGGRWLLNLDKRNRDVLDRFWEETLMLLVGESFGECSDEVCGSVVQMRAKGYKLAIWTGEARHEQAVRSIGEVFKDRLKLGETRIKYEKHDSTATKSGSTAKSMLTL